MPDIIVSHEGPIRKIRMNRPEKKNALTVPMYEQMGAAIEGAARQSVWQVEGGRLARSPPDERGGAQR